jgi:hypothetical protein
MFRFVTEGGVEERMLERAEVEVLSARDSAGIGAAATTAVRSDAKGIVISGSY